MRPVLKNAWKKKNSTSVFVAFGNHGSESGVPGFGLA
jgi:hypothetical protein